MHTTQNSRFAFMAIQSGGSFRDRRGEMDLAQLRLRQIQAENLEELPRGLVLLRNSELGLEAPGVLTRVTQNIRIIGGETVKGQTAA